MNANPATAQAPQSRFADPATWRALQALGDPEQFSTAWLSLMAAKLDLALAADVRGAFVALRGPDGRHFLRTASIGEAQTSFLLAKAAERCLQRKHSVIQPGGGEADTPSQIAVAVMIDDTLEGVVAFELAALGSGALDTATRLARWGTAWFRALLKPRESDPVRARAELALEAMGLAAIPGSAAAMAQALCTLLAERLSSQRVSLGTGRHGGLRVLATSHGAVADHPTDFLLVLAAAMDEAASHGLEGDPLLWPVPEGQTAAIGAHERLCRAHGAVWAASLPCHLDARDVVITIEGTGPPPNTSALTAMAGLTSVLAPLVSLRLDAERSVPAHARAATSRLWHDWVWHAAGLRRTLMPAALLVTAFLIFARGEYRVAAHATLEGRVKRALIVPFDGYLASAAARPGQRVHAGAELAALDTRDLDLQKQDQTSRIAESQHQVDEAVGAHDFAAAAIATARRDQAQAELSLVEQNLGRAVLRAPFDAVVISGDPSQQIGAPLRHGDVVYELSPLDGYRVAVDVDEADFAAVAIGQHGRAVLSSLPYRSWPLTITALTPLASARDGKTVFRVEASLDAGDPLLRPGMEGVAKIDTGARLYAWIWTHGVVDWLRLKLWAWLP